MLKGALLTYPGLKTTRWPYITSALLTYDRAEISNDLQTVGIHAPMTTACKTTRFQFFIPLKSGFFKKAPIVVS